MYSYILFDLLSQYTIVVYRFIIDHTTECSELEYNFRKKVLSMALQK